MKFLPKKSKNYQKKIKNLPKKLKPWKNQKD